MLRHRADVAHVSQFFFGAQSTPKPADGRTQTDGQGFRHFGPTESGTRYTARARRDEAAAAGMVALVREAPDLFAGLADAISRDFDRMANPEAGDVAR
jgi:hypothetical protein